MKNQELLSQLEEKKKEINEMRSRFHQTIEEKSIKIAYLNNEKYELTIKV